MSLERFDLDLRPRPSDQKHTLILSELITNAIRDYHGEHPELHMQDVQNAVRRVEADLLSEAGGSNELPPAIAQDSNRSWRLVIVTTGLIVLSAIAMLAALELIRRP